MSCFYSIHSSAYSLRREWLCFRGGWDSLRRLFHSNPYYLFTPHLIFFRKKRKACLLLLPFCAPKFSFSHSPFGCAAIFHYFMPPKKWEKKKEKKKRRRADLHEEEKSSRHTSREREKDKERQKNSSAEGDEEEEDFDQSSTTLQWLA